MKAVDLLSGLLGQPAPQDAVPSDGKFSALLAEAVDQQGVTAKQQGSAHAESELPPSPPSELPTLAASQLAEAAPANLREAPSNVAIPRAASGKGDLARNARAEASAGLLHASAQPQVALAADLGAADAREIARATDALAATPVTHAEQATPEEAIANEALLGQVAAQLARIVAPQGGEPHAPASKAAVHAASALPSQQAGAAATASTGGQQPALGTPQQPMAQTFATLLPQQAARARALAGVTLEPQPQGAAHTAQVHDGAAVQSRGVQPTSTEASTQVRPQGVPPLHMQTGAGPTHDPLRAARAGQWPVAPPAQPPSSLTATPQTGAPASAAGRAQTPTTSVQAPPEGATQILTLQLAGAPVPADLSESMQASGTPRTAYASQSVAGAVQSSVAPPRQADAFGALPSAVSMQAGAATTPTGAAAKTQAASPSLMQAATPAPSATPMPTQGAAPAPLPAGTPSLPQAQKARQAQAAPTTLPQASAFAPTQSSTPAPTATPVTAPALPQAPAQVWPQAGTASLPQATTPVALPMTPTKGAASQVVDVPTSARAGASTPPARASAPGTAQGNTQAQATQQAVWPNVAGPSMPAVGNANDSAHAAAMSPSRAVTEPHTARAARMQTGQAANVASTDMAAQTFEPSLHAQGSDRGRTRTGAGTTKTPDAPQSDQLRAFGSGPAMAEVPAQTVVAQTQSGPGATAVEAVTLPEGAASRQVRSRSHAQASTLGAQQQTATTQGAPSLQTQRLVQAEGGRSVAAPRGERSAPADALPPLASDGVLASTTSAQPDALTQPAATSASPASHAQHNTPAMAPMYAPPPVEPVRIQVTTQAASASSLEGAQQLSEAEGATARARGPGSKSSEEPLDRLQTFTRGAAVGSTLSAYGGRGHQGSHESQTRHGREREERDLMGTQAQSLESTARAFEQAAVHVQPAVEPRAPEPTAMRPQVPLPSPVQVPELPDLEFARAPVQPENASISLQHPDLGPIQLQVHRNHGRVEVHAVIDSHHAEAVLRANESGIRYGVQQSGMTLGALRVRMRDGEDREQPTTRGAPVRRRRMSERQA